MVSIWCSNMFWIYFHVCVLCLFCNQALSACPADWLTFSSGASSPNQTCYKILSSERRTFSSAASKCRQLGGYLARETSQQVHSALIPYVADAVKSETHPNIFWLGLTGTNVTGASWRWIDGPLLAGYKNFGDPLAANSSGGCVYISAIDSKMRWMTTNDCEGNYFSVICQMDFNATSLLKTTTTAAAVFHCPGDWVYYTNEQTCLKWFIDTPQSWLGARAICQQSLGDLVRIGDSQLNEFINMKSIFQKGIYWIGLNDRVNEGQFVWLDETKQANYTNWNNGMPDNYGGNENCVAINADQNSKWNDAECSLENRFMCQRTPMPGTAATTTTTTPSHVNCGDGWEDVPNSDNCLKFSTKVLSWIDARDDCQFAGGDLVSVVSVQEQFYLQGRASSFSGDFFWIGANDRSTEGGWVWTDGSPFAFLNWDYKQPDNSQNSDCVALVQLTGRWTDLPCQNRYGYICKKKGRVTLPPLVTTTTTQPNLPGDVTFGCPPGWSGFRGSCYWMVDSSGVDWAKANSSCQGPAIQGALAAITDAAENRFIVSLIPANYKENIWIGLQDPQENTFSWADGTPVTYTNWNPGEPNNMNNEDCVVMLAGNGKWNDAQCSSPTRLFLCKRNKILQPSNDIDENQGCANGSQAYQAYCYDFLLPAKNFSEAQKYCKARSGGQASLATVNSGHLQAFLSAKLSQRAGKTYWIGLSQTTDGATYSWTTNLPVMFTFWGQNHTGNERFLCVGLRNPGYLWTDFPCNTEMPFICQWPRQGYTTQRTLTAVTMQAACPSGWLGHGSYCYHAFSNNTSPGLNQLPWGDAGRLCASLALGGSLVTVTDAGLQSWLLSSVIQPAGATRSYWIGLNDKGSESSYVWADNSPFLFTNWGLNEPNDALNREDCVEWVLPWNAWNDQYCFVSRPWICQVPRGSVITTPKPSPTGALSPQCGDPTWILYQHFCYFLSPPYGNSSLVSWFEARQKCLDVGSDLTSIGGDDENGFLTSLISKSSINSFWIGLNDLDLDSFGWTDLSPVMYVAWALNEPNDDYGQESCVEMNSLGSWSDAHCQSKFGYVCKKRPGNFQPTPAVTTAPGGGCPIDFISLPSLSFCYYIGGTTNDSQKNYTAAMTACGQKVPNSKLASIHSSLEEKYILTLISDLRTPAWIGLNDRRVNNQFEWVDGLVVSYTNWGPGQPDENTHDNSPKAKRDCVDMEVRRNPGTWNDRQCETTLAYVCESAKKATLPTSAPNTTGCPHGYQRFHNSCYQYLGQFQNWTSAQTLCVGTGANLVTVNSGVEQAYVEILTGQQDNVEIWLGLQYNQSSASFSWLDGWPVRFTNWGQDQPKLLQNMKSCVSHVVGSQWQVTGCSLQLPFVCELNLGSPPPAATNSTPGRCLDSTWFNFAGFCYHIETSLPVTWAQANLACRNLGANLTSVHSSRESQYLASSVAKVGQDVWIGLFKGQTTGFNWYDQTPTDFTHWGAGEPNDPMSYLHQDCVKIAAQNGTWVDTDCVDKNAYICKMPQVPHPSITPIVTTRGPGQRSSQRFSRSSGRRSSQSPRPGSRGPRQRTTTFVNTAVSEAYMEDTHTALSGGAIAGIVIGVLLCIGLSVVGAVFAVRYFRREGNSIQRLASHITGFGNATYDNEDKSTLETANTAET